MITRPVVFIGAERVGKAVLESLLSAKDNIVAVFTAHPNLREKIADYVDFSDLERKYPQVNFHYITDSKNSSVIEKIKSYRPVAIFAISWSQIIPFEILQIPSVGVIGLHYSLLPQRRGGAPLNWALIDGLKESGVTLFYMDESIDGGAIIAQQKFSIEDENTVNDLLSKIKETIPALVLEYFDKIIEGKAPRVTQDGSKATYTPARTPEESKIDWSWGLGKIHNFIRALAPPYPSAFFNSGNKRIVFTSAKREGSKRLKVDGYIIEEDE